MSQTRERQIQPLTLGAHADITGRLMKHRIAKIACCNCAPCAGDFSFIDRSLEALANQLGTVYPNSARDLPSLGTTLSCGWLAEVTSALPLRSGALQTA